MAHTTAARNDGRVLIFKISSSGCCSSFYNSCMHCKLWTNRSPSEKKQLPCHYGCVYLQRNAGRWLTAVTAIQH